MRNRDKRSLVFSLALGDGCLHYIAKKSTGGITIAHAENQADWISWKAKLLGQIFDREVSIRTMKKNEFDGYKSQNQYQVSVCNKKLRVWRKFTYPNGVKSIPALLSYITTPELALAIWLADDGYIEPSLDRRYPDKCYGAVIRIFTCDQTMEQHEQIITWFQNTFGITPKVKFNKNSKKGKSYPFLKFNTPDSLLLWEKIRDFLLQFESMKHKFRYMEKRFQYVMAQRKLAGNTSE